MLTTIFDRRGTCMGFVKPNSFIRAGIASLLYRPNKRGTYSPMGSSAFEHRVGLRRDTDLLALAVVAVAHARGLVFLRVEQHHVAHVDRHLLLDDAALGVLRRGT